MWKKFDNFGHVFNRDFADFTRIHERGKPGVSDEEKLETLRSKRIYS